MLASVMMGLDITSHCSRELLRAFTSAHKIHEQNVVGYFQIGTVYAFMFIPARLLNASSRLSSRQLFKHRRTTSSTTFTATHIISTNSNQLKHTNSTKKRLGNVFKLHKPGHTPRAAVTRRLHSHHPP